MAPHYPNTKERSQKMKVFQFVKVIASLNFLLVVLSACAPPSPATSEVCTVVANYKSTFPSFAQEHSQERSYKWSIVDRLWKPVEPFSDYVDSGVSEEFEWLYRYNLYLEELEIPILIDEVAYDDYVDNVELAAYLPEFAYDWHTNTACPEEPVDLLLTPRVDSTDRYWDVHPTGFVEYGESLEFQLPYGRFPWVPGVEVEKAQFDNSAEFADKNYSVVGTFSLQMGRDTQLMAIINKLPYTRVNYEIVATDAAVIQPGILYMEE